MGVYIKGLDIPENCAECDAIGFSDLININCPDDEYSFIDRPLKCPLAEIPDKHKRLIEVPNSFYYGGLVTIPPNDFIGIAKYFADQVKDQPTVLEAEGSEC